MYNETIILNVENDQAIYQLIKNDTQLGKLIAIIGDLTITLSSDPFRSLVKTIIDQQLSVKAAGTINNRVEELMCGNVTPYALSISSDESLRNAGVSYRKISYIRDLVDKVLKGDLNFEEMNQLHNKEVVAMLTNVKGIGKWSAEMFLIFSLGRTNVLSLDDVGLQRAAKWLYGGEEGKELLKSKADLWTPHYTIASLYLWEAVNRDLVIEFENIDMT
ncbi:DNA-3-methyladenine glycosylase 2 family protein [Halobacillus locisalis]|uniref:DNA-3-methyladenine glycosylase II n=1 Tax=Halobacillus locisalis TaxID=220753 RepID=A0A838CW46_9BACI|nr:DNA-3-methyladenine glycosylase 2 family protein [Halobacillus locisalis]MBA2175836.1 DNA-3-methyladenine glycosylase 2 family protein [Halobacillus locisalis]